MVILTALVLVRQGPATLRFAPDPGFQFLEEALTRSVRNVLAVGDGYLQLFPRLIAYAVVPLPAELLAIASGLLCALVWGFGAAIASDAVADATSSRVIGRISGAWLVLNPGAHESMLGNLYSARWILLAVACIVLAAPSWMRRHRVASCVLLGMVGLSHAYIGPLMVVMCVISRRELLTDRRLRPIVVVCVVASSLQGAAFLLSTSSFQKYGADSVYAPWSGMGVFWISVIVVPPVLAILSLIVCRTTRDDARGGIARRLALAGFVLWLLAYLQLGIKDSPSVVTLGVTPIASLVAVLARGAWSRRLRAALLLALAAPLAVLCVKYFPASWYVTSGDEWRSQVQFASRECATRPIDRVVVRQFMATIEMRCDWLT